METPRCDLCQADEAEILYAGQGWKGQAPEGVALVRCRRCGLMYLNPRPGPEEIGRFYPDDYGPYRPAIEDERWGLMRWMRQRKMDQRRALVERYAGRKTGRILDVGCATGVFLRAMAQAGWQAAGVELSPAAAEYARQRFGLEVFTGMLRQSPYPAESFDAVTFWDVLEHTFSPREELRHAARLLRPGGVVAVNVPHWHSLERRLFGPFWSGLDSPRHLYVFTRATLTALLEQAGLRPAAWVCFMPAYFAFIISLERWLGAVAPRLAGPVTRLLNTPGLRLPVEPAFTLMNWLRWSGVISVFAIKEGKPHDG